MEFRRRCDGRTGARGRPRPGGIQRRFRARRLRRPGTGRLSRIGRDRGRVERRGLLAQGPREYIVGEAHIPYLALSGLPSNRTTSAPHSKRNSAAVATRAHPAPNSRRRAVEQVRIRPLAVRSPSRGPAGAGQLSEKRPRPCPQAALRCAHVAARPTGSISGFFVWMPAATLRRSQSNLARFSRPSRQPNRHDVLLNTGCPRPK